MKGSIGWLVAQMKPGLELGKVWVIIIIAPVFLLMLFILFRLAKSMESARHSGIESPHPTAPVSETKKEPSEVSQDEVTDSPPDAP